MPKLHLFRSYIHPSQSSTYALNPSDNECPLKIWEVCRATSAAPSYFKSFQKVQGDGNEIRTHTYLDGGTLANNPAAIAFNEALHMARIREHHISGKKAVGCLISIGTGRSKYQLFQEEKQSALSRYMNMSKAPRQMITDSVSPLT